MKQNRFVPGGTVLCELRLDSFVPRIHLLLSFKAISEKPIVGSKTLTHRQVTNRLTLLPRRSTLAFELTRVQVTSTTTDAIVMMSEHGIKENVAYLSHRGYPDVSASCFLLFDSPVSVLKGKQLFLLTYLLKQWVKHGSFSWKDYYWTRLLLLCESMFLGIPTAVDGHTSSFRSSPGLLDRLSNNQSSLCATVSSQALWP